MSTSRIWRRVIIGQVRLTERHTMQDFAHPMQWLVDECHPEAEIIRVVLDNLDPHKPASLVETFPPAEARRILKKLEFHYMPKHGSWLNMAEIERCSWYTSPGAFTPMMDTPTLYPEINRLLAELYSGGRAVLGDSFTGMYLDGSLACGAFDFASDVDFVIVTEVDVVGETFEALQALHERLALQYPVWGNKLEGSYISRAGLRHYDPEHVMHPLFEWGEGERLKMAAHDAGWDIHRYILREHGVRLAGPPPQELIDPVTPDQLHRAASAILTGWAAGLLAAPEKIQGREYQSYTVLSLCRILYTLQIGNVATKPIAARWCQERLGPPWSTLIERALEGRQHWDIPLLPGEVQTTLDFIRYAVAQLHTYNEPEGDSCSHGQTRRSAPTPSPQPGSGRKREDNIFATFESVVFDAAVNPGSRSRRRGSGG